MAKNDKQTRTSRLVKLLVAKLVFDLFVLIGAVVAYAYLALPPPYRGWTDQANEMQVSGWVADRSNTSRRVEVQLFVDGRFVAERTADMPRPDVAQKFPEIDPSCGFRFEMPRLAAGEHRVDVYAIEVARQGNQPTVQQIGSTLSVRIE